MLPSNEERERLCALQFSMRAQLIRDRPLTHFRYVGGADLTVDGDLCIGCLVVVDCERDLAPVYEQCARFRVDTPYISGLLCFREGPVVVDMYRAFCRAHPEIALDALLVDGCGEWHPRGFGLACYVGLECNVPTIGVSKSFLYVGSEHSSHSVQSAAQSACPNVGDAMRLHHALDDGREIQCGVMRTTNSTPFKPIFVSVGHLVDYDSAVDLVRHICRFREPEPLRLADRISRQYVRDEKKRFGSRSVTPPE